MITVNGVKIVPTMFPDRTSQVWKIPKEIFNRIDPDALHLQVKWQFENESEIIQLAQLKDLLDQHNLDKTLEIAYLPYGRQDKEISNESTFALRSFAKLLNAMEWEMISIMDPHSEVAIDLIENSHALYPRREVEEIAQLIGGDTIFCYPDKGALKKYNKIYDMSFRLTVTGNKVRNQLTGNIESYELVGNVKDKNVLIVDDIADGGATFILLTKELLKAGSKEVNLFVTHGIFSKGLEVLKESGIKRIFTKDGEK